MVTHGLTELTECGDLSEVDVEETETAAVAVKTVRAIEMAAVTITTAALMVNTAVMMVNTVAMLRTTAVVVVTDKRAMQMAYRRELWHIISSSEVRCIWNITV
jgi:hypothetical protein